MGILSNAKREPTAKGKKKEVLRETVLLKESQHKGIGDKVNRLQELREQEKSLKAELAMLDKDVNDIARKEWIKVYKQKGENPKMIILTCENGTQFNAIPADAYCKVDDKNYDGLIKLLGKDIVTIETVHSFRKELLEKHFDAIEKLFKNCNTIPKEDKDELVYATDKYEIAKGTIDKLMYFKKAGKAIAPEKVFEEVKPTVQLKF